MVSLLSVVLWLLIHFLKGQVKFGGNAIRVPFVSWWDARPWYLKLAVVDAPGVAAGIATMLIRGRPARDQGRSGDRGGNRIHLSRRDFIQGVFKGATQAKEAR